MFSVILIFCSYVILPLKGSAQLTLLYLNTFVQTNSCLLSGYVLLVLHYSVLSSSVE